MKEFQFALSVLFLSGLIVGCGGQEEIPPSEGGESTATEAEIQKQMQESMSRSGGNYNGGNVPGSN